MADRAVPFRHPEGASQPPSSTAFFAGLRPNSLTRVWAFKPSGIARIEKVVLAAQKYNQKLVLTLADGRSYCGEWDGYNGSDGKGGRLSVNPSSRGSSGTRRR